ncbi:hypothetical protein [Paenibacillus sp. IHBB 10380]|uniref:hypothetical protein n=1 Tax=Paenibacillus sp. IHBB 10380 TaxID=1566358 RepID=UPI0005CFB640|nr:hypothetical protein [Paenibacillus sp. IHBB 10380]AJS59958.1 hypothetical protein UB51_17435 [Paenibacillus sp. IHBB 10380]
MSVKLFSQHDVNKLKANPYVKNVSKKALRTQMNSNAYLLKIMSRIDCRERFLNPVVLTLK